jgi:hypothetical protein
MAGMPLWNPDDPMYPYRIRMVACLPPWWSSTELHPAREPVSQFTTHGRMSGPRASLPHAAPPFPHGFPFVPCEGPLPEGAFPFGRAGRGGK